MRWPFWIVAFGLAALPIGINLLRARQADDPRLLPEAAVDPSETYSNILPADYVGPQACSQCHAKNYRLWQSHPHRFMNQSPTDQSVRGDFNDAVLELPTGSVRFSRAGADYVVTTRRAGAVIRRWRVTRTVGTRYMQFYIGVLIEGPEPSDSAVWREHMIPFSYWISSKQWLPKPFFDADGPEEVHAGQPIAEGIDKFTDIRPWTSVCLSCHNTTPYVYRAAEPLYAGFRNATVSLAVRPLSELLQPTIQAQPSIKGFLDINSHLDPEQHLVTLGISCESCHFGGREHVVNKGKMSFLPRNPNLQLTRQHDAVLTDSRQNPATLTGLCTQCHSGNAPMYPNGGAQCNSREALDFSAGACQSQMTCVNCHEPHTASSPEGAAVDPAHLAACINCHPRYADTGVAAAHSGHSAAANVTCLDCHMPRQVLGLDGLVRTHRVGLPVEASMLAAGMANACNLCHLDRSLRWTIEALDKGWQQRIEPQQEWKSLPHLDEPAGDLWLHSEHAGMRLVASQSYRRSPLGKAKVIDLVEALNDPEPINRLFHLRAVESLSGRAIDRKTYQVTDGPADRERGIARLREELRSLSLAH